MQKSVAWSNLTLGGQYLGTKIKKRKYIVWLFMKINLSTTTSIERPCEELSIEIDVERDILKLNYAPPLFYLQKYVILDSAQCFSVLGITYYRDLTVLPI